MLRLFEGETVETVLVILRARFTSLKAGENETSSDVEAKVRAGHLSHKLGHHLETPSLALSFIVALD